MKKVGIYFLYDSNDKLIYIGKSTNLDKRIKTSCELKKAEYVRIAELETRIDATIYESYYIARYKPKHNKYYADFKESTLDLPRIELSKKIPSKDILSFKGKRKQTVNIDSANFKKLRLHLNLTQVQFAELLGTTQITVSAWENGKCPAYIEKLAELALEK